ncbi:hypothetical protein [Mycoplasmopsis pulmonis]|uniref:hypothetical protein n=1 Tax=Mycoplasmopsis pulmonis TaxID=2107 RepID=UPI001004D884|nr:hypothetical protein [Mycoplasmopsis pulmonis]VEU67970.1 Uncharacterised protein [Mycoplasmopsis pulmonis]
MIFSTIILAPTALVSCGTSNTPKTPNNSTNNTPNNNSNNTQNNSSNNTQNNNSNNSPNNTPNNNSNNTQNNNSNNNSNNTQNNETRKPESNTPSNPPKQEEMPNKPSDKKWWEVQGESKVELLAVSSDGKNLNLTFKEEIPAGIKTKVSIKKDDQNSTEEKTFDLVTTKSKTQTISLGDLEKAKWKISKILFGLSTYTPTKNNTFDSNIIANTSDEEFNKIKAYLEKHLFAIKDDRKNLANFSNLSLNDFDLKLNPKSTDKANDIFTFTKETLDENQLTNVEMKISFESTNEDIVNKKRSVAIKVQIGDKVAVVKNLEWNFKTNLEIVNQYVKDNPSYKELENHLINTYFSQRQGIHPFEIPTFRKYNWENISLKDEVVASFSKFGTLDDYNGNATLHFTIKRGNVKKGIEITIGNFAKVGNYESGYDGAKRSVDFELKSSSHGGNYKVDYVFTHYNRTNDYWYTSSEKEPTVEFAWRGGIRNLIYGFELLIWNDPRYYKENSYVVEYKESANGEWKALDTLVKDVKPFEKDKRFIQEIVEVKKVVNAVRIRFLDGKKPRWVSIASLMPITKILR